MLQNNLIWICLVALGRAMVHTDPPINNQEDLDGFVRVAKVVHEQEKKVVECVLFINMAVLPAHLAALGDMEARVGHDGNTYYDKYNKEGLVNQGQGWSTKLAQIDSNLEVIAPDPHLQRHL